MNNRLNRIVAAVLALGAISVWAEETTTPAKTSAKQESTPGIGHGAKEHGAMQGGTAPPDARDPHAYAEGYDFGPIPRPRMGDEEYFGSLLVDRLERVRTNLR